MRHLRTLFELQPGRPAWITGLRAAIAVTVPYALASLLGLPDAGWTGLTGLLVTLADPGGSYRARTQVMGAVTVLGALVGALAAPLGGWMWRDALLLFGGVFAASFFRCYGETAGSVGNQLAVIFVASLGARAVGWEAAVERGGVLLFGGVWAMLQGLLLWPVHPFLPARKAIAEVYSALGEGAEELAALSREGAEPEAWEEAASRHAPVRRQIEDAREILAATRMGRPDEPRRGEHLLALLELSEPMLTTLFALAHAMEVAAAEEALRPVRDRVAQVSDRYAEVAGTVAVIARDPAKADAHPTLSTHRSPLVVPDVTLRSVPGTVADLLARLRDQAREAHATALAMGRGDPIAPRISARSPLDGDAPRVWWEPVRENFAPDSVVLRHALRAGLVAAAALIAGRELGLIETHWMVLAAIGVLQPYSGSTEEKALQRVVGTLGGALLAVGIASGVSSQPARFAVIGVLTATSVSLLPINFGAFQVLLTPDFLLLATLKVGDLRIAESRAEGVVIACFLALLGVWFLWPSPERHRFPDAAADVLRANGNYLRLVAARGLKEPTVSSARREVGLALLDAEASFDRLMAEYHGPPHQLEPAMTLLSYSRRMAAAVTALVGKRRDPVAKRILERVAHGAGAALETLADALQQGQPPPPLPALPQRPVGDDPVSRELLVGVPRQLDILHGAVEKLTAEREVLAR